MAAANPPSEFEGQYRIRAGDYCAVFRLTGPSTNRFLTVAARQPMLIRARQQAVCA
jgi:hypothetical protein